MHLGIGPIVTASIIMQLFVGAKIIKLDLTDTDDKAVYQSTQKFLVIIMILVEAVPQVFGYLQPSSGFTSGLDSVFGHSGLINGTSMADCNNHHPAVRRVLSRVPHGRSGLEMGHRKWNIALHSSGSGASHIHGYRQLGTIYVGFPLSLSNPPVGAIPKTLYILHVSSASTMASGGYERILLQNPNPVIALVGTIMIFMFVSYIESTRIELPLAHGTARGARGRYPIKLIYASNIPVILMAAVLANVSMFSLLLWNSTVLQHIPLIGGQWWLGFFASGSTTPSGGIAWYLSTPQGVGGWLLPILNPASYGSLALGHSSWEDIAHVAIFFGVWCSGPYCSQSSGFRPRTWVQKRSPARSSPRDCRYPGSGVIPGFSRECWNVISR